MRGDSFKRWLMHFVLIVACSVFLSLISISEATADERGKFLGAGNCNIVYRAQDRNVWKYPLSEYKSPLFSYLDTPNPTSIVTDQTFLLNLIHENNPIRPSFLRTLPAENSACGRATIVPYVEGESYSEQLRKSRIQLTGNARSEFIQHERTIFSLNHYMDTLLEERYPTIRFPVWTPFCKPGKPDFFHGYELPSGNLAFVDNHPGNILLETLPQYRYHRAPSGSLVATRRVLAIDPIAVVAGFSPSSLDRVRCPTERAYIMENVWPVKVPEVSTDIPRHIDPSAPSTGRILRKVITKKIF